MPGAYISKFIESSIIFGYVVDFQVLNGICVVHSLEWFFRDLEVLQVNNKQVS